jgi:general secretion pathway protein J
VNLNKGFTLIEVMVALLIFAIVSVLAAQGLKILLHSHTVIREQGAQLEDLQIALFLIERNLSQSVDRSITDEQNTVQPVLIGASNYIEFTHGGYTNPQGIAQRSTLQRTAYLLVNGQLIQRDWPVLDQTDKTVPSQRSLIKQISGLSFRYFDNVSQPHTRWPATTSSAQNPLLKNSNLPCAVEMTLTLGPAKQLSRVFIIPGGG